MKISREQGQAEIKRYPYDFEEWPRSAQVEKVADKFKREGIIEEVLLMCGVDPENRDLHTDTKLTKEELAAVKLTLEGIDHDS